MCSGTLLRPDEVTFSIMVRGLGSCSPPRWTDISALLRTMDQKYELKPNTGGAGLCTGHAAVGAQPLNSACSCSSL